MIFADLLRGGTHTVEIPGHWRFQKLLGVNYNTLIHKLSALSLSQIVRMGAELLMWSQLLIQGEQTMPRKYTSRRSTWCFKFS